jgi:thioredoxin reductase (NADPH)
LTLQKQSILIKVWDKNKIGVPMGNAKLPEYDYDIIIIGGGPAGFTAGLYAARAGLQALLLEGAATVSQITVTDMIENYPGIPDGINGFDLMLLFKNQALKFGLEVVSRDVLSISRDPTVNLWIIETGEKTLSALSVIAATGAQWRKLGVPGETEFAGKGVSYCATCDGPFYRNQNVVVVGGGDSAIQEALFLTHFAQKVSVIHRRDRLRAAAILQKRAFAEKKIEFVWNSTLSEVTGNDLVTGVKIKDAVSGELKAINAEGVFIFAGRIPHTDIFRSSIELDEAGYIITDDDMKTSAAGFFAAGDCRAKLFRQVVTAAGDGATAAFSAELYIGNLKGEAY